MQTVIAGLDPPIPPAPGPPQQPVATTIRDAPLGLDVDMDQLPGPLTLIAHHLAAGPVQLGQPGQPVAIQHRPDRGAGLPQRPADPMRPHPVGLAPGHDGLLALGRQPPRAPMGPTAPVDQPSWALGPIATQPLVAGRHRHSLGPGRLGWRPTLLHHPLHQQPAPLRRQLRPRMHPESLPAWSLNRSERGGSHLLNNLSGNYS
jgi:hypothetical protein